MSVWPEGWRCLWELTLNWKTRRHSKDSMWRRCVCVCVIRETNGRELKSLSRDKENSLSQTKAWMLHPETIENTVLYSDWQLEEEIKRPWQGGNGKMFHMEHLSPSIQNLSFFHCVFLLLLHHSFNPVILSFPRVLNALPCVRSVCFWMGGRRSGIYHTYLIITITGNGPEEVGALALLISVSRKHARTHTHTARHTQLISAIWLV